MKAITIGLALALVSCSGMAQEPYKCKINGSFVYQDRPCPGAARYSESMPEKPTPVKAKTDAALPASASQTNTPAVQTELEKQKAFLARGAKDRKISDLKYQIENTEAGISHSHSSMQNELAILDRRRDSANNNLAGSTYLESLATEKSAVTSRYESELRTLRERLQYLRDELAKAQKAD